MAPSNDLEQDTIDHTQKLVDGLAKFHELSELWTKSGIVGDIVLFGPSCTLSISILLTRIKPFTADIAQANINELRDFQRPSDNLD